MSRKMKDLGIEWIGEIPEKWDFASLGSISSIQTGNTPSMQGDVDYYESGEVLWVKPDNLKSFTPIINTKEKINQAGITKARIVPPNTPLVCCIGSIGKFGYSEHSVAYNQQINSINFDSNKIYWKYGLYYLSSQESQHWYYSTGNVVRILNSQNQKLIKLPIPTLHEQHQIANYLDQKVSQIDHILERTRKSIEEYKKYKQSIITEAVTKGLDPDAKMKDSGIEWIGEIPEDWEVVSPNRVCEIIRGNSTFQKDDLKNEGDYVAVQYGKIYKVNEVDKAFDYYVDEFFYKEKQIVKKGDTVLVSTSETLEDLGHSCFYNRYEYGLLGGEQMCLKPDKSHIVEKFLYYATTYFKYELNQYSTGLKVFRFRLDDLKNINIVIPPIDEQSKIINFLNNKIPLIDKIIDDKEFLLSDLESYKKSLIYECVTGKKEVV